MQFPHLENVHSVYQVLPHFFTHQVYMANVALTIHARYVSINSVIIIMHLYNQASYLVFYVYLQSHLSVLALAVFAWWVEQAVMREEWRCVSMECGGL